MAGRGVRGPVGRLLGSNLTQRILSAAVILAIAVPATVVGGPPFWLVVALLVGAAWWEYSDMGRAAGLRPFFRTGGASALGVCLGAAAPEHWRGLLLAAGVVVVCVTALLRTDHADVWHDASYTLAGVLWIGWLAGYAIVLRGGVGGTDGLAWLLSAIAITIAADSGAYVTGRTVGRQLLSPRISPKKTVEGVGGGVVAAALVGLAAAVLDLQRPWWQGVLVGIAAGLAVVAGDLLESLLKRQLGVKDSSRLIPGHGGVLDRIDGLLFALPVTTICVILLRSG